MNAPGAHYVANADAKVQLFFGTAITFYKINNISWFYDTSPSYFMVRFILRFFSLISFKKNIIYLCSPNQEIKLWKQVSYHHVGVAV